MNQTPPARSRFDGIIFDLDGCLVRGTQAVPGAAEAVAEIKRRGIKVAFLTQESVRLPLDVANKLNGLGISVDPAEVLTAGVIAAGFIRERYPDRRILAVGAAGLIEPLRSYGLDLVDLDHAAEAEVVVVGRDPLFDLSRLTSTCQAIWQGAKFLALGLDRRIPVENGYVPGTGAMVKAVAHATNKQPTILGKPSRFAGQVALNILGVARARGAVIGDGIPQDIRMGKNAGIFSILVLSGASKPEDIERTPARFRPDLVLPDVTHLPPWLEAQTESAPLAATH